MATFESMERRMPKIEACLKANGLESLDACRDMLLAKGIDCDAIVKGVQPICFENAVWAYTLGTGELREITLCDPVRGYPFQVAGSLGDKLVLQVPRYSGSDLYSFERYEYVVCSREDYLASRLPQ